MKNKLILIKILIGTCLLFFACKKNLFDALKDTPLVNLPESIPISNTFTQAVTAFAVHNGKLYAGTKNTTDGAEVYVYDGGNLTMVYSSPNGTYEYVDCMYSYGGRLYVSIYRSSGAIVKRTTNDTVFPHLWEDAHTEASPYNSVGAMMSYGGRLYLGVSCFGTGKAKVLDSVSGSSGTWNETTVGWGGYNDRLENFIIYEGHLYAATIKEDLNYGDGAELWYFDGSTWSARVDSNTPAIFGGGFGYPHPNSQPLNMGIECFAIFGGSLYMGVRNQTMEASPNPSSGCKLWRSSDMTQYASYDRVVGDGFGDITNISIDSLVEYDGYIYAFTRNYDKGTQMWRSATGAAGTWTKRAPDGFSDSSNVSGRAVIVFSGILYIGLEKAIGQDGATIVQYGSAP